MIALHQFDETLRAVEELGLFQNPRRVPLPADIDGAVLEGEVIVEDKQVTLQLVLNASFPLKLPRFRLCPRDALGFIPHVDPDGGICFADPEGLVMDRRRPVQIVQESLQRALSTLADGVTGRNHADFIDELEVYWSRQPGVISIISLLDPPDRATYVNLVSSKERPRWLVHAKQDILAFDKQWQFDEDSRLQRVVYLPLEPGTQLIPPDPDGPFWTVEQVRNLLLPALSTVNKATLEKLVRRSSNNSEYVIVKLSRPSSGATLFGIRYDGVGKLHPLRENGTARRLVPIQLHRFDRSYLIHRGGGDTQLSMKRVLLVGCGAVGGHLAFELARAGVLNLTLVDPDILSPDNTFRHALGRSYWGRVKVEALKEAIEAQLPYVQVRAVHKTIQQAIGDQSVRLADYDLVVFALGTPTIELEINEQLHALQPQPLAVFTWLEPLGIGGHALLTGSEAGGCFECLYTPADGSDQTMENRAAFAAPGQHFGRALSGCGSMHTPYGSMDATRTAAQAARLVVNALTGQEMGNPLLSWKGDSAIFEDAGFQLAYRYQASEEELRRQRYAYRSTYCRVCGNRVQVAQA